MRMLAAKPKTPKQIKSAEATKPDGLLSRQDRGVSAILSLQWSIGNQAVLGWLQTATENTRASSDRRASTGRAHDLNQIPVPANPSRHLPSQRQVKASRDQCRRDADRLSAKRVRPQAPKQELKKEGSGRAGSADNDLIQCDNPAPGPRRLRLIPSLAELMAASGPRLDALERWLEANHITVSLSSMTAIIRAVRRDAPATEGLSDREISAFVRRWAAARHLPMRRVGPAAEPSPPSLTLIELPEWLSLYESDQIGFHVTLNPAGESPLPARITAHFRERGLPVNDDLLSDLFSNREAGIAALEALLRRILPAEFGHDIPGIATYIADELMDASLEAHVQRERPTTGERWEARDERIRQIFAGSESTEIGPIQEFIENLGVGISLTVHF